MNNSGDTRSRLIFGLPETVIDVLIPICLNLIFLGFVALLLWAIGETVLTLSLAKGFLVFWIITVISILALHLIQRLLRVSFDSHATAFVISNLVHGICLLAGWSAFTVMAVREAAADVSIGVALVLWVVGIVSGVMAHVVVTTFYKGTIYTLVNVLVIMVSFVIFGVWPAMAQMTFGWFFNLFG